MEKRMSNMKLSIVPSQKYPLHQIEITDWVAKTKDIKYGRDVTIVDEEDGVYEILAYDSQYDWKRHWIPKNHASISERTE
jgi:hypothetical protein